MHSSAISLLFRNEEKGADTAAGAEAPKAEEFLINLIDSPGHIDFSSDVSTATRLCDGALLVVDVLEGICTQTHAVVYKALKERMRPCLVLNKIDRLFIDMKLSSTEAFQHLKRLLEQVNALAYTLLKSEVLKRENISEELAAKLNKTNNTGLNASHGLDEEIEDDPLFQEWNFEPEKGNVIFCSALDCWGFGTAKFANIWSKRLGVNRNVLRKYLFEDYAFNPTTKKIVKIDTSRGGSGNEKPMFASMVLDPLWQLYEAALVEQDATKAANMANKGVSFQLHCVVLVSFPPFGHMQPHLCAYYDLFVVSDLLVWRSAAATRNQPTGHSRHTAGHSETLVAAVGRSIAHDYPHSAGPHRSPTITFIYPHAGRNRADF